MGNFKILDCTLRDGGYINNFKFGNSTIKDIISKLTSANTDIIECGFLKSNFFDKDCTLYGSVEYIKDFISPKKDNTIYVAMIAYGDISNEEICICDESSIDGIRLTFHQDQIDNAFKFGKELMKKNYKVFMQPVGTTAYTDDELIDLVDRVNDINPFAFYMVDTLGSMFNKDLIEMFNLIDKRLNAGIRVGFHSHNNLQMSFSNAIQMLSIETDREIIIDSSVFGMGRGAGNLCTELIMKYINQRLENRYDVVPVLEIFDEHINKILLNYKWGYSLPYFIASMNNCHPNYATHLTNKQTISIKEINYILSSMSEKKKNIYDKQYIEDLYISFQKHNVDDSCVLDEFKRSIIDRDILLLAPGKSISREKEKVIDYCKKNNSIVIAVNFIPKDLKLDYLFISNHKRIKNLGEISEIKNNIKNIIITSNLTEKKLDNCMVINYSDYLNEDPIISDNGGLMLINLLCKLNIKSVSLAGFDGFSVNSLDNYYNPEYMNSTEYNSLFDKTKAIANKLHNLSNSIEIKFLTESRYEKFN